MKKEVLIAIVVGFTLGLVITFGVYRAQKSIKGKETILAPSPTPVAVAPSPTPTSTITISKLEDGDIVEQEELQLSGTAPKNAFITITTHDDETITQADANGSFTGTIKLSGGANTIRVTALDENNESSTKEIVLVYSTADLDKAATSSATKKEKKETQ